MTPTTAVPATGFNKLLDDTVGTHADFLLRLVVGGMLLPHGIGKFFNYSKELEVFGQVFKLQPPEVWVIGAAVFQIAAGLLIIFDRYTRWASLAIAAFMVATIVLANSGNGWFWHMKGIEYAVMWALLAVVVAGKSSRR
jgi:uncharacterized membrane protein YphA (DoxX/SURF4 family)